MCFDLIYIKNKMIKNNSLFLNEMLLNTDFIFHPCMQTDCSSIDHVWIDYDEVNAGYMGDL